MFYLNKIELKNFRCYKNASFNFNSGAKTIFVGKNASGKTSAVEGIYYLAFGKSFKTSKDDEIISKDTKNGDALYIKGTFSDNEVVEIGYDRTKKLIKKSDVKIKSLSELVGYFKVVLFCSDDLYLIKGDPKYRRRFIDTSLSQVDKDYLKALQREKEALKQRNEYLKQVNSDERKVDYKYLEVISKAYIEESKIIEEKRIRFIEDIKNDAKKIAEKISDNNDSLDIKFLPNVNVDNFWITFKEKILSDIYAKTTTWGPSRDDFESTINGVLANSSASQGQIRTACLALKLAVVKYYKKITNNIIIILDDVFSELDENRQNKILEYLNEGDQVFITTTNINLLTKEALDNSDIIEIRRGE